MEVDTLWYMVLTQNFCLQTLVDTAMLETDVGDFGLTTGNAWWHDGGYMVAHSINSKLSLADSCWYSNFRKLIIGDGVLAWGMGS